MVREKKSIEENKFKKIISSFWFWIIVALVFYILFILMPVQYNESSFGWDNWKGINLFKTIFGYFYAIAILIAIILLIISIIKYIQKSPKLGDYWKIAFTIIGIIGIIAFVIFYLSRLGIFNSFSSINDDRIGDLANAKEIKIHIELLEEDGYEVVYFYYALPNSSIEAGSLTMKSLGNQNEQVWRGLFALSDVYPNAPNYTIHILEPTQECWYHISGNLYRAYQNSNKGEKVYATDGTEMSGLTLYQSINYQIDKERYCS